MKTKQPFTAAGAIRVLTAKAFVGAMFATALLFSSAAFAQVKIGTNPTTIATGSALEVEGSNKGVRMPQVSLTDTKVWAPLLGSGSDASSPGMSVYNSNASIVNATLDTKYPANGIGEYFWDGTGWVYKNATTTPNLQVVYSLRRNANQTIPAFSGSLSFVDVAFDAKQYDKNNNFDLPNKTFTVPTGADGYYQFNIVFVTQAQASVKQGVWIGLYVNGTFNKYIAIANSEAGSGVGGAGCGILQLAAGDVVKVKIASNASAAVVSNFFQLDAALISR